MEVNKFELHRNDKCICGSNRKYKQCCLMVHDSYGYLSYTDEAIDSKNYELSFAYCNADITKYLISMKRHTEPLIANGDKMGYFLLEVDIKALDEMFRRLTYIIHHGSLFVDVDTKFSLLETVIDNREYFELVRYYRVLFISLFHDETDTVKRILNEMDFKEISNVRLLELYCQYISNTLERTNLHRLYDKIIDLEDNLYDRIKFLSMKALDYFLNNEINESNEINDRIIILLDSLIDTTTDSYKQFIISNATYFSGVIRGEKDMIADSIGLYEKLLEMDKNYRTAKQTSDIYNSIGESYIMLGDYSSAIEAYVKGLETKNNCLGHINIARSYIRLNDYELAYEAIKDISLEQVPDENLLDYLLTMGSVITVVKDYEIAKSIYEVLKDYNVQERLFSEYKLGLLMNIMEEYKGFADNKDSRIFISKLEEWNSILELKPNFFGLGININAIISKFTKKEDFRN